MKRMAMAAAVILTAACGSTSVTAPPVNEAAVAAGTYNLERVNGSLLPFPISTDGKTAIMSATEVLTADHSYTQTVNYRKQAKGVPDVFYTITESGTFELANSALTFHPANGAEPNATRAAVRDGILKYTGNNSYTTKYVR